jgi:hypothetical protein
VASLISSQAPDVACWHEPDQSDQFYYDTPGGSTSTGYSSDLSRVTQLGGGGLTTGAMRDAHCCMLEVEGRGPFVLETS